MTPDVQSWTVVRESDELQSQASIHRVLKLQIIGVHPLGLRPPLVLPLHHHHLIILLLLNHLHHLKLLLSRSPARPLLPMLAASPATQWES